MNKDFWKGIFRTFALDQILSLISDLQDLRDEKYREMIQCGEYMTPTLEMKELYLHASKPQAVMMYRQRNDCDIIFAKMVLDHCYGGKAL